MRLTQRTLTQSESPIGAMAHLMDQVPADKPLLDLSQGAPNFPTAPEIAARVGEVALEADGGAYTQQLGLPKLRSAFCDDLKLAYGGDIQVGDIGITAGCNQAFAVVASALAEPGDEIILTLPYYFNHDMWLGLDGIKAVYLDPGPVVVPSVADARLLITEKTRALVLVTPGNPTGQTLSPELLNDFADLAIESGIVLIVDETYRSYVPGNEAPHQLFSRPEWRNNVISLHSFSKDFAIPGYRVGAIVGQPELLSECAKLIDCIAICPSRLGQEAVVAGLTQATKWKTDKVANIAAKQKKFEEVMSTKPGGFELLAAGAFYGWVRHGRTESSNSVAKRLLLEQGILAIPGEHFGPVDPGCLRFSFANADVERLDELTDRLAGLS